MFVVNVLISLAAVGVYSCPFVFVLVCVDVAIDYRLVYKYCMYTSLLVTLVE